MSSDPQYSLTLSQCYLLVGHYFSYFIRELELERQRYIDWTPAEKYLKSWRSGMIKHKTAAISQLKNHYRNVIGNQSQSGVIAHALSLILGTGGEQYESTHRLCDMGLEKGMGYNENNMGDCPPLR